MAIDMLTGREAIPENQKQTPGVHPHMRPSPRGQRFQQYPRMLYKGPANPVTVLTKMVDSIEEEKAAVIAGWRLYLPLPPELEPAEPQPVVEDEKGFFHRGPGRPRKVE